MSSIRFVLYSKGLRGRHVFESLAASGFLPIHVVLENPDAEFENRLTRLAISHHVCSKPKSQEHRNFVEKQLWDLVICAGYSKILPEFVISAPILGAINCHGGRLPQYRGAAPIPWQIINGEKSGTAYVLVMTKNIDDGAILASEDYLILDDDTASDITTKVVEIFSRIVPQVVEEILQINAIPVGVPQPIENICHWARRYPEDGKINWNSDCKDILNLVRALDYPYPGAFFELEGESVIVVKARIRHGLRGVPGRVIGKTENSILVACKDTALEVLTVKSKGKLFSANLLRVSYGAHLGRTE